MTCFVEDRRMAEKEMGKQIGGCMAGFLHLFDRHQLLAGKRVYSSKRLPQSSPSVDSASGSVASVESPPPTPLKEADIPATVVEIPDVAKKAASPLPLPLFEEGLRSSWKLREAPRLSLDSRVGGKARVVYANPPDPARHSEVADKQEQGRRAPGVVARLMGLDALPPDAGGEAPKKAELRRSASESRVSRFVFDGNCFHSPAVTEAVPESLKVGGDEMPSDVAKAKTKEAALPAGWRSPQQRRSFFDAQDVFPPEPAKKVSGSSLLGEIEKRLRMRGIDEQASDLETLKQILEALQLKGLLHSAAAMEKRRNLVFDGRQPRRAEESPIVVMKPARSPRNLVGRRAYECSPPSSPSNSKCRPGVAGRRAEAVSPPAARANRTAGRSGGMDSNVKSPRRMMNINVEIQRKRSSSPKRACSDSTAVSPSSRNRKMTPEKNRILADDESSTTMSESNISTYSQFDAERYFVEDYKEGRNLLERCDKLLHSIAEITANDQPSPVSVLDASFYKDEESPPPVAMKRCLDFNEALLDAEDVELWSPVISPVRWTPEKQSHKDDFLYVAEVLRAMGRLQPPNPNCSTRHSEIFTLIERKLYSRFDSSSKAAKLHRRLLFDTITEIVDRQQNPNSWTAFSEQLPKPAMQQRAWAELERIRRHVPAEDICEVICGVLGKDMGAGGPGSWSDRSDEMSEAVLDIERLIFKDLVGETIRDLAVLRPKWEERPGPAALRRKLAF